MLGRLLLLLLYKQQLMHQSIISQENPVFGHSLFQDVSGEMPAIDMQAAICTSPG
jgi:hypothetical protein